MIVFVNGQFISEQDAVVSVFDRGFLYGDGIFETILVASGVPFRFSQHIERLQYGAQFLQIPWTESLATMEVRVKELLRQNQLSDSVLRIQLTRGIGTRGYSPRTATSPSMVISLHPPPTDTVDDPPDWRIVTSSLKVLADDPLSPIKSTNKIRHILAKAEAEKHGADEALLLNSRCEVAEVTSGNIFWIHRDTVFTPPLSSGALPGITRTIVLGICGVLGLSCRERAAKLDLLRQADGVFITMSTLGLVNVVQIDGERVPRSPIAERLRRAYISRLQTEIGIRAA